MTVVERINSSNDRLTPAEQRVARALVADPNQVAFGGTVAELAERASSSGPTVLRLATKLGYDGYASLQEAVQAELARQLRPAVERIRSPAPADVLAEASAVEGANVAATLEGVDRAAHGRAVALLADRKRAVHVLSGEASAGLAVMVATELDLLRDGVSVIAGSEITVGRALARVSSGDVLLAIELRRYERWVLTAAESADDAGAVLIGLTDSLVSPLARLATEAFVVAAAGVGPFDSHVGTLALANTFVAGVARRLRVSATRRLDAVEAAVSSLLVE